MNFYNNNYSKTNQFNKSYSNSFNNGNFAINTQPNNILVTMNNNNHENINNYHNHANTNSIHKIPV